jgi:hypothetical protein
MKIDIERIGQNLAECNLFRKCPIGFHCEILKNRSLFSSAPRTQSRDLKNIAAIALQNIIWCRDSSWHAGKIAEGLFGYFSANQIPFDEAREDGSYLSEIFWIGRPRQLHNTQEFLWWTFNVGHCKHRTSSAIYVGVTDRPDMH